MKPFEWKVEDYLGILQKKEKATHSSILTCKIPRTEEPGGLQSMGSQKAGHDWATNIFTFLSYIYIYIYIWREGNPIYVNRDVTETAQFYLKEHFFH